MLLFRLRLAKSRATAQARIAEGHIRINGQRLIARDKRVVPGDVLTLAIGPQVLVIAITALPDRRGPPAEARECYRMLDAGGSFAIADCERPPVHNDTAERIKGNPLT